MIPVKTYFKLLVVLAFLALNILSIPPAISEANDNSLYGFTKSGTFFLHKDVVSATQLWGSPQIMGDFNGWNPSPMTTNGNYYIYKASTTGEFYEKQCFCFKMGNDKYIPHVLISKGSKLILKGDYEGNGQRGYNFCTEPQSSLPF